MTSIAIVGGGILGMSRAGAAVPGGRIRRHDFRGNLRHGRLGRAGADRGLHLGPLLPRHSPLGPPYAPASRPTRTLGPVALGDHADGVLHWGRPRSQTASSSSPSRPSRCPTRSASAPRFSTPPASRTGGAWRRSRWMSGWSVSRGRRVFEKSGCRSSRPSSERITAWPAQHLSGRSASRACTPRDARA